MSDPESELTYPSVRRTATRKDSVALVIFQVAHIKTLYWKYTSKEVKYNV